MVGRKAHAKSSNPATPPKKNIETCTFGHLEVCDSVNVIALVSENFLALIHFKELVYDYEKTASFITQMQFSWKTRKT